MSRKLKEQVEKILDEGTGERRGVIVRMTPPEKINSLMRTVSDAIQERNLSLSARDVLPVSRDNIVLPESGKRSPAAQRQIKAAKTSITSQMAAAGLEVATQTALRTAGLQVLEPLLSSNLVRKAVDEMFRPKARKPRIKKQASTFWISKSIFLDISKDDLSKLPSEVPQIQGIYPNRRHRLPPTVETQKLPTRVLENKAASWGVHAIGALASWGAYGARGEGVKVGLLDTGVDASHPDLKDKVVAWAELNDKGEEVAGSRPYDTDEHGTHCAGTTVGGNESRQWIGVAPEGKLAVALVLNGEAGGTDAQIQAGIQWTAEQGVDVISMSLGGLSLGPEVPDFYTESILSCLRLGIPIVVAIGNSGHQTTGAPGNDFFAFSVGATDHEDRIAGFSGGRTHIIRDSAFLPPDVLPLVWQ